MVGMKVEAKLFGLKRSQRKKRGGRGRERKGVRGICSKFISYVHDKGIM